MSTETSSREHDGYRRVIRALRLAMERELSRCDREIEEIRARDNSACPAYLSTLGVADWEREKRLIQGQTVTRMGGPSTPRAAGNG
jgi:hypothetical protein